MCARRDGNQRPPLAITFILIVIKQLVLVTSVQAIEYSQVVTINTEPPGSRVYVGGRYVGTSPVMVILGPVKLHWTNPGFFKSYRWLPEDLLDQHSWLQKTQARRLERRLNRQSRRCRFLSY